MNFWDAVELLPAVTTVDAYNTPKRGPDLDADPIAAMAVVQFTGSTEDEQGGQRIVNAGLAMLPPGTAVDGWGYLRHAGTLYEVDGDPLPITGPGGIHHYEARLRKVR